MEIALEEADRELELASTCGSETKADNLGFVVFLRRSGAALSLLGLVIVLVRFTEDGFVYPAVLVARRLSVLTFL
mgnify:FL=1